MKALNYSVFGKVALVTLFLVVVMPPKQTFAERLSLGLLQEQIDELKKDRCPWDEDGDGNVFRKRGKVVIGTDVLSNDVFSVQNEDDSVTNMATFKNDNGNKVINLTQNPDGDAFLNVLDDSGESRAVINSNGNSYFTGGNVGIGTSTPVFKLTVGAGTTDDVVRFSSSDPNATLQLIDNTTTEDATLTRLGNSLTLLKDGGNVGIGTEGTPGFKLTVGADVDDVVRFSSRSPNATLQLIDNTTTEDATLTRLGNSLTLLKDGGNVGIGTKGIPGFRLTVGAGTTSDVVRFSSSSPNATLQLIDNITTEDATLTRTGNNLALLKDGGNVGIGLENPPNKLSVKGIIETTVGGVKFPDGTIQTTAATGGVEPDDDWTILGDNIHRTSGNVGIGTEGTPGFKLTVGADVNDVASFSSRSPSATLRLIDNTTTEDATFTRIGNNLALLKDGGSVGIGTENPQSLLAVNGTITAKECVITLSGWSDFVFKDDYNLMPLEELEQRIEQDGHLPDIPSAEEVTEQGVSIGEMQAKLLMKIEELTLYVIELKKENEQLKERVSSLGIASN